MSVEVLTNLLNAGRGLGLLIGLAIVIVAGIYRRVHRRQGRTYPFSERDREP